MSYPLKSLLLIFAMALFVIMIGASTVAALGDQTIEVGAEQNAFTPAELLIQVGETVTWTNVSGWHNVVSYQTDNLQKPLFTSGNANIDLWQYSYTFTEPGVYNYYCLPHETVGMTGTITVQSPTAITMNGFELQQTLPIALSSIGLALIAFGVLLGRHVFFIEAS